MSYILGNENKGMKMKIIYKYPIRECETGFFAPIGAEILCVKSQKNILTKN